MSKSQTPLTPTQSCWIQNVTAWEIGGHGKSISCQSLFNVSQTIGRLNRLLSEDDKLAKELNVLSQDVSAERSFAAKTTSPVKTKTSFLLLSNCFRIAQVSYIPATMQNRHTLILVDNRCV